MSLAISLEQNTITKNPSNHHHHPQSSPTSPKIVTCHKLTDDSCWAGCHTASTQALLGFPVLRPRISCLPVLVCLLSVIFYLLSHVMSPSSVGLSFTFILKNATIWPTTNFTMLNLVGQSTFAFIIFFHRVNPPLLSFLCF